MEVSIEIHNKIGIFKGESLTINEDEYVKLVQFTKEFYKNTTMGFESRLEDGSFMVVPPELLKESIMIIKKIK